MFVDKVNNASVDTSNGKYALFVQVQLPALGYNTYYVKVTGTVPKANIAIATYPTNGVVVENQFLHITFDSNTNLINQIINKKSSINVAAQQQARIYSTQSILGLIPYLDRLSLIPAIPVVDRIQARTFSVLKVLLHQSMVTSRLDSPSKLDLYSAKSCKFLATLLTVASRILLKLQGTKMN